MRKTPAAERPRRVPDQAVLTAAIARRLRHACLDAMLGLDGGSDGVALTIAHDPVPLAPVMLARSHTGGADERRRMQAIYERCLTHYRDVLRPGDAARGVDDVGAAVARFVAANFRVLQGIDVEPATLRRLESQLSGVVRVSSGWASASPRDRQLYFEKMAVLAVFMREIADQAVLQGDAAVRRVRAAARGYLHELLGLAPEPLTIGPTGLTLRRQGREPAAAH
jgi:hypothetical protein